MFNSANGRRVDFWKILSRSAIGVYDVVEARHSGTECDSGKWWLSHSSLGTFQMLERSATISSNIRPAKSQVYKIAVAFYITHLKARRYNINYKDFR
jgi:hypothetical protein